MSDTGATSDTSSGRDRSPESKPPPGRRSWWSTAGHWAQLLLPYVTTAGVPGGVVLIWISALVAGGLIFVGTVGLGITVRRHRKGVGAAIGGGRAKLGERARRVARYIDMHHFWTGLIMAEIAVLFIQAAHWIPATEHEPGLASCRSPLEIGVLLESALEPPLQDKADQISAEFDGNCYNFVVYSATSEQLRAAFARGWPTRDNGDNTINALRDIGPRPDIWIPATYVGAQLIINDLGDSAPTLSNLTGRRDGSVFWNRLAFALPVALLNEDDRALARSLNSLGSNPTWLELFDWLLRNDITPIRPNPGSSSTGLLHAITMFGFPNGPGERPDGWENARVDAEKTIDNAPAGLPFRTNDEMTLLCDFANHGGAHDRVALLVSEGALSAYRRRLLPNEGECGGGRPELAERVPEGALSLDYPVIYVDWDTGRSAARRAAADYFLKRLREDRSALCTDFGSDANCGGSDNVTRSGDRSAIVAANDAYNRARQHGRVLFAVDQSEEMGRVSTPSEGPPLAAATSAIRSALSLFGNGDRIGVDRYFVTAEDSPPDRGSTPDQPDPDSRGCSTDPEIEPRVDPIIGTDPASVAAVISVMEPVCGSTGRTIAEIYDGVDRLRGVGDSKDSDGSVPAMIVFTNQESASAEMSTVTQADVTAQVDSDARIPVYVLAFNGDFCDSLARGDSPVESCASTDPVHVTSAVRQLLLQHVWGNSGGTDHG